jgi:hypothetical protein
VGSHETIEHAPAVHALDACGTTHVCPQLPQFIVSADVIASQPSSVEPLQSV